MLRVSNLRKAYGGKDVLRGVSFVVNAGERLAVVGPNGAGKSTLLRILAGLEPPDSGHVLRSPPSLAVGYLPQGYAERPDLTVEEALPELARRRALEREVERLAAGLAGNEADPDAYGAALAALALQGVNLLPLDEPTNHLDIPSRKAFEEALGRFPGTVLVVSHDRFFVEAFAGRTLVAADGTVRDVPLRA